MRNILLYFILIKSIESKSPLRVIGGRDAASDEYPYVVRIEKHLYEIQANKTKSITASPFCTGSVLTPVWTISAAHCFYYKIQVTNNSNSHENLSADSDEQYTYVIGYGLPNNMTSYSFSKIDYYINHQAYHSLPMRGNVKNSNDVALVRHQFFALKQYGKVAGLDFTSLTGHEVTLAGYGLTHDSHGDLYHTMQIQKPLQLLAGVVVQCPLYKLMYPVLCIAGRCGQVIDNACGADSGGPVIHAAGIVGVISKGKTCLPLQDAMPVDVVSFTTPLSPYVKWISDHIRKSH